jgi:hypothetical protein
MPMGTDLVTIDMTHGTGMVAGFSGQSSDTGDLLGDSDAEVLATADYRIEGRANREHAKDQGGQSHPASAPPSCEPLHIRTYSWVAL